MRSLMVHGFMVIGKFRDSYWFNTVLLRSVPALLKYNGNEVHLGFKMSGYFP